MHPKKKKKNGMRQMPNKDTAQKMVNNPTLDKKIHVFLRGCIARSCQSLSFFLCKYFTYMTRYSNFTSREPLCIVIPSLENVNFR